ncbi:MAG: WD40/YVTN/BNR-like repeat-containing protein, partial [Fluviicola sp.]
MKLRTYISSICTLLLFLSVSLIADAALLPFSRRMQATPGNTLLLTSLDATKDVEVNPKTGAFVDVAVVNRLTLGVDKRTTTYFGSAINLTATVEVETFDAQNLSLGVTTHVLNVNYDPFSSTGYVDKQQITLSGAYKMIYKLVSVQENGTSVNHLKELFYIDADIFVERYEDFTQTMSTQIAFTSLTQPLIDTDCDGKADALRILWPTILGAEEYQLEWAHVNNYGYDQTTNTYLNVTKPANELEFDFKNNSTRISTSENYYDISLIYEKGWIVYRLRALGVNPSNPNQIITGVWNTNLVKDVVSNLPSTSKFELTAAHENLINWQYSATYAEQGKKKEIVSYFDGTMRYRQMVTKVNSDNNTIVGETIYDHQGRPAITVLPTPVNDPTCTSTAESSLHFYRNFNQNEQGENYSRVDFDISGGSNACNIDAKEMGTQSGSSQYYSPNNPDLSNENAYIPDAKKYPFTQIEYTPDNTGRIRRQSGVGEEFQLGSGHESKYFYGKPQQVELDRLFGSEVGVASHYQKNVVLDPNGQASISYLDQEGRVIATALAGDETPNLKVLESEAGAQATLTTDVFEYNSSGTSLVNKLNIDGDAIEFNSQLTVAYQSNYTFDYSFTIAPLAEDCLPSLCIDCVYDLTLEVKDECGTVLNSSPAINQKMVGKFTPTASGYTFHAACQAPVNGTDEVAPFTVQLGVGNYGITKVLRINEEAKQAYITNYLDPTINNCVLTLEDFQNEALSLIDTSGCEMTCQECLDQLGTLEDFLAAESGTQADYYELKQNCDRICNGGKISECEIKMNMMKIDMTPGGQYGEYELNGVTNVSAFALSVYNSSNLLEKNSASQGNWKFPKTVKGDGTIVNNYLNDDETQAYVLINFDGVNYIPSVVDVTALIDNGNGTFNSKPENLTNVTDFIENFEPSWAEGLLTYHPEYCYYEQCLSLDKKILPADDYSSYGFDDELVATTTFADAVTKGFIKSNWATITTPNARLESWFTNDAGADKWDPFVVNYGSLPNSGSTAAYNTQLSSKFNLYQNVAGTNRSMTEFAAYSTRCIVSPSGAPVSGSNCYNFGDPASAASVRDEEWNRLKTLYLSYKRDLIYKRGNEIAIKVCSGYNGCIGNENFNPSDNGFFTYTFPSIFNAQALNPAQPCALATAALYVDKQPRFTDGSYLNMDVPNEAAYLNYQLTGQCPTATNFEQLLASLITTDQLDNTGFNLNAFQPYNNLKLAANTYASPGTLPTTTYISTISGNTINATFTDGTVSPVTMTISKPVGSPAWDFFTNIYGLDAVGSSFTAQATYQLSAGATPVTVELNGTLNGINIANCSFEESCETYTFTRDVATLISAVAASGQITSASPVSITPLVVSGTPVSGVPSATIQTVAGSNNLVWSFNSSFKEFRLASSTANSLDGIFVKVVSTNPATFTNFAGILNVTDVQAEAGNTFTLQVQTTTGPATLTCSFIERSNNGVVKVELPAGACSLPTPLNCQNDGYENLQDLQALLEDVLINQPYNNASGFIDVSTSTAWVPNLQQVTGNPTAGFGGSIVNAGLNRLQKINMGSCSMELSYTLPASLAGAGFAEMVEMTDLEIGAISTPLNESFQFKFKGTFNLLGNVVVVPITGVNTCIPLRDCKPCDETVIEWDSLTYTTYENTLENSGDVVVDGTLAEYDIYVAAIDQLNTSNGWSVTDPLYVRAQTYDKFFVVAMNYPLGTYTGFILNYVHGLDDYTWLTDPNLFVINYGHSVNVEYEYKRYLLAIQRYNSKAQLFGMSTLTAIDLSTFANYRVADNTSAYIVYLEALPTSLVQGQNIIPYLNASNSTSTPATALYSTYVANYMTWRTSISGTPSFQQQLRYHSMYSYTSFDQNNLFCSTPGLQAATTYVNSFSASSTPVDFPSLATCTSPASATDIAEVQRRYIQYVNAIRRYNTSFWATTNNLRLTQEYTNIQTFTRANVAPCVESYEQYLEPYRLSTIANNPAPVLPQAFSQYAPCNQVSIKPEDPCKAEYDQYINCLAQYNAWAEKNYREGFIKLQFDYDKFKGLDLCRCVEEFCDRTSAMINGTAPFTAPYKGFDVRRYLDITLLCQENRLPCDQEVSDTQIPDMPELEIVDNCKEMMINQAYMSAQNNYENYLQNLLAELDEKYTTHCLSVKDHLNMTYDDKQYHYTLYYYDQAGNLIKTVPPAGVKSLDVSNASLLAAITADRDNGTKKVFTTHTLETRYEYNSLNQLVAQSMPDQDEMEIFEPVLANGVVAGFETKTIQMITESRGYMGGNVTYTIPGIGTSKRTYLYQTENGGQTWSRVHGLVGADLVKVEMASTTLGAAIGKGGVVLLTRDGGNYWDLLNNSQYVKFNTDLNYFVFVNNSG